MTTNELKRCVYRILGDLTKSDNVISVDEMDTLDSICDTMKITPLHKNESYSLTLADAVNYVAKQDRTVGARIVKLMEECALKDGESFMWIAQGNPLQEGMSWTRTMKNLVGLPRWPDLSSFIFPM